MVASWRSAVGSLGERRSTLRYSFSALTNCLAASASAALDNNWSLLGALREQPAATSMTNDSEASKVHLSRAVDKTDVVRVAQEKTVIEIMEFVPSLLGCIVARQWPNTPRAMSAKVRKVRVVVFLAHQLQSALRELHLLCVRKND